MQEHYRSAQLGASSSVCGLGKIGNDSGGHSVGLPSVSQLLEGVVISEDYVRMLLDTIRVHDAEKLALLQRIDDCVKPEQTEVQRLRREVSQRGQEIVKLQQELSESCLMLQEERERANRLLHENTVLLAQAEDDRAKVVLLLHQRCRAKLDSAVSAEEGVNVGTPHPSHGEGKKRPPFSSLLSQGMSRTRAGVSDTMSLRQVVLNQQPVAGNEELTYETDAVVQDVLRAPQSSMRVTALEEEVRMLREQLDAQRAAYENERTRQLNIEHERTRQHAEEVGRHIDAIDHLHALHRASLADLIRTRHDMQIEQRELRGKIEKLTILLSEALSTLETDRRRHAEDLCQVQRRTGDNFDVITRRLRQELGEQRALAMAEKEQHNVLLTGCEAEIERLQEALKREKKRHRRLEERRRLELEGMNSEVNLMRQALRAMEKRVYFSQGRCLSV